MNAERSWNMCLNRCADDVVGLDSASLGMSNGALFV